MKAYTFWDRIKDILWNDRLNSIEYYFAKRWLDRNFGKQEYWGDYLLEKLYPNVHDDKNTPPRVTERV